MAALPEIPAAVEAIESAQTRTFGVVLNAAPLTNVVITITNGDLT